MNNNKQQDVVRSGVELDPRPTPANVPSGRVRLPPVAGCPVESTDGVAAAAVADVWSKLLVRHLLGPHRPTVEARHALFSLEVAEHERFQGSIKSGWLGGTRFCYLKTGAHVFVNESDLGPFGADHIVVVQLSGSSVFSLPNQTVKLMPGHLLLINRFVRMKVEHRAAVEQLVLYEPLRPEVRAPYARDGLVACQGQSPVLNLLTRWTFDACLSDEAWMGSEAASEVAGTFGRLIHLALCEPTHDPLPSVSTISREALEDYVQRRIEDPELDVPALALAFDCSVRTLHRAFRRRGGESLERFIWRTRLEACARALRDPGCDTLSLTALALQFGFTSPAHFSVMFRKTYGVSPSEYRRSHRLS